MYLILKLSLTFLYFLLFTFLYLFLYYYTSALSLFVIIELIWITLFVLVLIFSFVRDNFYILSLIFFILVFSSAEVSIGFVLLSICASTNKPTTLTRWGLQTNFRFFQTFNKIK